MGFPKSNNITIFSTIGIIMALWATYLINPNIIHYQDIRKCQKIVSEKMKDPESTKFMDYTFEKDDKWTVTIYWKYKATNSYWAYIQWTFSCVEWWGIQMQSFID